MKKLTFMMYLGIYTLCFIHSSFIIAAWVDNEQIFINQPDWTVIRAFITGDEFFHRIHDENGYTIVKDEQTDNWTWGISRNGDLESTGLPIHTHLVDDAILLFGIKQYENISEEKYLELRNINCDYMSSIPITPKTGIINNQVTK